MSADRDALAALLEAAYDGPGLLWRDVADAILAAGWRPPVHASFTCPRCGAVARRPQSVAQGFCGVCQDFTGETA